MEKLDSNDLNTFVKGSLKNQHNSKWERIAEKFVNAIFGVVHILLKEDEDPYWLFGVLTTYDALQKLTFPFSQNFKKVWNNHLQFEINDFAEKLSLNAYIIGISTEAYLTIFYLFILMVACMMLNVGYVSFSISRSFFTSTWPLHLLRNCAKFFVTVLFMPTLEILMSIFQCSEESPGKFKSIYAKSMNCFDGTHFLHLTFAAVVGIIFIFVSLTVSLTFFEVSDHDDHNTSARLNSRGDSFLVINKFIWIICFTFLQSETYIWFNIILILTGGYLQFCFFYYQRPYYTNSSAVVLNSCNGIYLFACILILIQKLLQGITTSIIYIWLVGSPLIIFYFIHEKQNIETFLIKANKNINSGEELATKLRLLVKISVNRFHNREYLILLKGFIKNHLDNDCTQQSCPIRQIKKKIDDTSENVSKNVDALLLAFANQEYLNGLIRFQNNYNLRLAYALFLYHYQKQTFKAKTEFEIVEKGEPPIDIQFIIFRYKKMIDEGEQEIKGAAPGEVQEALDVVSEIAYESHFRQCSDNILQSAKHFAEFWSIVIKNNPVIDLKKLNRLSLRVNETLKNVHNHWFRMQHYKPNVLKACQMYANFQIEILNNPKEANEIMLKCNGDLSPHINTNSSISEYHDDFMEGCGLISCLNEESSKFGMIIQASSNCNKIFLTNHGSLHGHNLNQHFADFYQGEVLKSIQEESQNLIISSKKNELETKEIVRYAKQSNQRVFPVSIKISDPKITINEIDQFRILIRPLPIFSHLKENKLTCFFIIDENLQILYYSDLASDLIFQLKGTDNLENSNIIKLFPEFDKGNHSMSKKVNEVKKSNFMRGLKSTSSDEIPKRVLSAQKSLKDAEDVPTLKDTVFYSLLNNENETLNFKLRRDKKTSQHGSSSINVEVSISQVYKSPKNKVEVVQDPIEFIQDSEKIDSKADKNIYSIAIKYELKDSTTKISLNNDYQELNNSIVSKNQPSKFYGNILDKMDPEAYLDLQIDKVVKEISNYKVPNYSILAHIQTKANFRNLYNFGFKSQIFNNKRFKENIENVEEDDGEIDGYSSSDEAEEDDDDDNIEEIELNEDEEKQQIHIKEQTKKSKEDKKELKRKETNYKISDTVCEDIIKKNQDNEYQIIDEMSSDIFKLKYYGQGITYMIYSTDNIFFEAFAEPAINRKIKDDIIYVGEEVSEKSKDNHPNNTKKTTSNDEKKKR